MGIENGLPDLLEQFGLEIHDLKLDGDHDGKHVGRNWASRAIHAGATAVYRRLRKEKVDPLRFKQVFTPTVDSSDSELYPLNRRVEQVIRVFDDQGSGSEFDYWPLSPYQVETEGWVLEPDHLRLRKATISGTLTIWAIVRPVRPSYGLSGAATSATTLVLATDPVVGKTDVEPNKYVGSRICMESGDANGDVRRVTSQAVASGVVTLTVPAFSSTPTGSTDSYSTVLDVPDCMARAAMLRGALIVNRTLRNMDREMDDLAASYQEAYGQGKSILQGAKIGHLTRFRQLHDSGFSNLG
jgi:hypothetical protein